MDDHSPQLGFARRFGRWGFVRAVALGVLASCFCAGAVSGAIVPPPSGIAVDRSAPPPLHTNTPSVQIAQPVDTVSFQEIARLVQEQISNSMQQVNTVVVAEYSGKVNEQTFFVPHGPPAKSHEYHFKPISFLKGVAVEDINLLIGDRQSFAQPNAPEKLFKKSGRYLLLVSRNGFDQFQQQPQHWYVLPYFDYAIDLGDEP